MSYPIWPASLPQEFLLEGFSNSGELPVRRQQMESGLDRVTRVSSSTIKSNTYSMLVDEKQKADFWSFFDKDANAGADLIQAPMLTGNAVGMHLCRFTTYPTIARHGVKWKISFTLETDEQFINWS